MSHTPGRGHRRKSDPHKKKRFRKKGPKKKIEDQKAYEDACKRWDAMSEEKRKLLPEFYPGNFKP